MSFHELNWPKNEKEYLKVRLKGSSVFPTDRSISHKTIEEYIKSNKEWIFKYDVAEYYINKWDGIQLWFKIGENSSSPKLQIRLMTNKDMELYNWYKENYGM